MRAEALFGFHTRFIRAAHPCGSRAGHETSAGDLWESQSLGVWPRLRSRCATRAALQNLSHGRAAEQTSATLTDVPHNAAHRTSNFLQMMGSSSLYPEGSRSVRQLSKAAQHIRGDLCSSSLTLPLWKDARLSLVLPIILTLAACTNTEQNNAVLPKVTVFN